MTWPAGITTLMLAVAGLALAKSNGSRVIVYNDTDAAIAELTVSTCGQSRSFRNVGEGDSVGLELTGTGGESDIAVATNGIAAWRGDYLEAAGGYRAVVRLRADGRTECHTTISCWQRWFALSD